MLNLKNILRGLVAASAVFCLASIGAVAQDQAAGSSSQPSAMSQQSSSNQRASASSNAASGQLDAADKHFMKEAAQGGMAEVQLGQLATQNAKSDEVKQFGQRMVDDHSKANDQLKQIAEQKGVTLPTDLSSKDKAEKDRLSKLQGEAFDRAYMQAMVTDHKKDVAEFKKEASNAKDSDVKNFASQTLPTLEDHLKQAQQVKSAEMSPEHAKKNSTTASTNPKQ
jgi:putative membrane protein